jgi:hypothetical protein
MAPYEALYGW